MVYVFTGLIKVDPVASPKVHKAESAVGTDVFTNNAGAPTQIVAGSVKLACTELMVTVCVMVSVQPILLMAINCTV